LDQLVYDVTILSFTQVLVVLSNAMNLQLFKMQIASMLYTYLLHTNCIL
jgi:hypothetical protein